MSQIELDLKKGEALKAEGMELVTAHSSFVWKDAFRLTGTHIANHGEPFTAETIVHRMGCYPPNRNAIGAAMNALARELKLTRVGYQKAKRPSRHAAVVAVWRLI